MNTSGYIYILRRWCEQEDKQAQVVIIRSQDDLDDDQIFSRLKNVALRPEEFRLIDLARNSSMVLDTWERGIECESPVCTINPVRERELWAAGT